MTDSIKADIAIIGGGMAGASAGYFIADNAEVVLLERESQPGYHTTGRSAALLFEGYGNAVIRAITKRRPQGSPTLRFCRRVAA